MKRKTINAKAKCQGFSISVKTEIQNNGSLSKEEISRVEKKMKQKLADSIASLPFSEVYPFEVRFR